MKIALDMIRATYAEAKKLYEGDAHEDAATYLKNHHSMNKNSALDYIHAFKKMVSGEEYKRTLNKEATNFFLTQIRSDYGVVKLVQAIDAVQKHVDYYEEQGRGNLPSIRNIISVHKNFLHANDNSLPDEMGKSEARNFTEGMKKKITVKTYERNPRAKVECIKHYGVLCTVCGFDFEKIYGEIGKDFIHVHHIIPLSEIGKKYELDPIKDLRPVCPNCHAMLHKRKPSFTVKELQRKM